MDPKTEQCARGFLARIPEHYDVAGALLYGSRARGDWGRESDADLAVLLRGPAGDRADAVVELAGLAFDVLLETGILLDPLPLWEDEWNHPERFGNPALIAEIRRDGERL
jgi:predicted nucleotidyltransferase